MESSKKQTRWNAASFFLTYSQCTESRDTILQHLQAVGGKMREWLIVREHHEDGNPHIHALIKYEDKKNITNPRYFDTETIHPNFKTVPTKADWIKISNYLMKEDILPLKNLAPDVREEKNKALYEQLMQQGPDTLLRDGKIHPLHYSGYKRTYREHLESLKTDEREELPSDLENPWGFSLSVNTDVKKCHFWIYSHLPDQGKTTWGDSIVSRFRAEFYSYTETFQAQIYPSTEIIILDEFRGQLKIYQINQLCDGKMNFTKKNHPNFRLENKPLVIVLSNRSISEVYKGALDVKLVHARFMEYEASLPLTLLRQTSASAQAQE